MTPKISGIVALLSALYALPPLVAPCFDPELAFTEVTHLHLQRAGMIGPRDELTHDPGRFERPRCTVPPVWSVRALQTIVPAR
jgi:hypothetical protein